MSSKLKKLKKNIAVLMGVILMSLKFQLKVEIIFLKILIQNYLTPTL